MRRQLTALAVLAAFTAAGCSLGPGTTPGRTDLLITRDFGAKLVLDNEHPKLDGQDTVMRMLDRNARTEKRYGGKFVQSIDGVAGGTRDGLATDWIYYVNGIQADKGAASTEIHTGDQIWWDNHPWQTSTVGGVVGQFPEPFLHGINGQRLPVRIECADPNGDVCKAVQNSLVASGIPAARARLASQLEQDTLRIVVGPIQQVRGDRAVALLAQGPQESGVFAKASTDGKSFDVLGPTGKTVRTIGAGSGLIASILPQDEADQTLPVWVVTGVDEAGLEQAANAFNIETLSRKFALAIDGDGVGISLPVQR